ncbi:hypothetical protein MAV100_25505 [Mycobacterium avium subsp. hominissuis 100]|nr:hypothetical protein MAV100_25505 [Mycobacterium avium subsp. hominissuis 100]
MTAFAGPPSSHPQAFAAGHEQGTFAAEGIEFRIDLSGRHVRQLHIIMVGDGGVMIRHLSTIADIQTVGYSRHCGGA